MIFKDIYGNPIPRNKYIYRAVITPGPIVTLKDEYGGSNKTPILYSYQFPAKEKFGDRYEFNNSGLIIPQKEIIVSRQPLGNLTSIGSFIT